MHVKYSRKIVIFALGSEVDIHNGKVNVVLSIFLPQPLFEQACAVKVYLVIGIRPSIKQCRVAELCMRHVFVSPAPVTTIS